MNQDSSQEVFQLPVPVRGFLNLRVRLPPKDDSRRVELVSKRRSAMLYKVDDGGESLAVKVINRLKYKDFVRMCWKNIARREHDSAMLLLEAGIRVPQPRLWFRNWNLLSWVDSIFVADFLDGLTGGNSFLHEREAATGRRNVFLEKYVCDLVRMLDAGLLHLDVHPDNVLWSGREQDALVWLDNDVMRFPGSQRSRWREWLLDKHQGKVSRKASLLTMEDVERIRRRL
jgi:hypothetical protein